MHRRRILVALLVLPVLALSACGGGGGSSSSDTTAASKGGPPSATVEIKSLKFTPGTVSVGVGESVEWKFDDNSVAHDVVFKDFKSDIKTSGTYEHTFSGAGTFSYHCSIHPFMKGTVEVH